MNYKMVVLDLDGTLLDDEKKISQNNKKILNELHNRNIEIVIATGRNYFMAKNLIEDIKTIKPVILANNGAIIRSSHNDELIEYKYLDSKEFKDIFTEGLKNNLHPVLHVDEYFNGYDMIYEQENYEEVYLGYIKKDYNRARLMKFNPEKISNILSVCYFNEYNILNDFNNKMKNNKDTKFNSILNRNISKRSLLEFLHPDGCKWSALKKYASSLNIHPEEIIAIGDDNNDIELLKNVGLGIAMVNGTAESQKAAKQISKFDNNNSGIYHELIEIFQI